MVAIKQGVHVVVSLLAKVEGLSNKAIAALKSGNADADIFTSSAGNDKVVFIGMDRVYTLDADLIEVVSSVEADFEQGILPINFSVDIPVNDLADFLQSRVLPFEIGLTDAYLDLSLQTYDITILKQQLDGELY